MTYNKKNYYLYYPSNRKLEIFSHYSITTNKKIIENLRKINSNKYNIIDSNVTDGNLEILKK